MKNNKLKKLLLKIKTINYFDCVIKFEDFDFDNILGD